MNQISARFMRYAADERFARNLGKQPADNPGLETLPIVAFVLARSE